VPGRPIDVTSHVEVEPSVAVQVSPGRAGGPAGHDQAGLRGDVDESSPRVVAIQGRALISGDQEVRIAVVVEVAHRRAMAVARRPVEAYLRGDVPEPPAPEVAIEAGGQAGHLEPRGRLAESPPAREEEIGPAIGVVVEDGDAAPERLQDRPEPRLLAVAVG